MPNLILPDEIRAEFAIKADGTTRTTIRGAARLAGVDEKALRYQFSSAEKSPRKLAQKLMSQGFDPAEFSTRGIEEVPLSIILEFYSFDAGARCTTQARLIYRAFASVGIRAWLHEQLHYQPHISQPEPQPNHDAQTLKAIEYIFAGLAKLGLKTELVESAKLSAIALTLPNLSEAAEVGKQLLSTQMAIPELPMSPTKIGKIITQQLCLEKPISARRINETLVQFGFQIAERVTNAKGKTQLQYTLTEKGEQYARLQLDTAQGHNKTVYVVRWFESIIPLIIDEFKD